MKKILCLFLHLIIDPEEFLNILLGKALNVPPFLEISTGQTSYIYQLFVGKDDSQTSPPTVQEIFEKSLQESKIKFKKLPKVLILQMPRFGVKYKVFDQILPTGLLDVTDFIEKTSGKNENSVK